MSIHIVMTGYDHTVFMSNAGSDTRARLVGYGDLLHKQSPGAHITYIGLRAPCDAIAFQDKHVTFIPLSSNILQMPLRLMQCLRRLDNISLICTQTPYEDGMVGMIYAALRDIPFAVQVHNDPTHTPGGYLRFLRKIMARLCFMRARLIRVVNPLVAQGLTLTYGDKVKTIPVPPAVIPPLRTRLPADPHILVVSRLSPEKGVDVALQVMARVQKDIPTACLTIAGEGAQRETLEILVKTLGIRVAFLGGVVPANLADLYNQATLLMLTSYEEGWGRVLVEAMFAGIPIVATRTKGSSYLVQHDETGYLKDVGDVAGLSESVIHLCLDHTCNARMGQSGYRQSQHYHPDILNQQLVTALLSATE